MLRLILSCLKSVPFNYIIKYFDFAQIEPILIPLLKRNDLN